MSQIIDLIICGIHWYKKIFPSIILPPMATADASVDLHLALNDAIAV